MQNIEEIRAEFERRDATYDRSIYHPLKQSQYLSNQERERATIKLLKKFLTVDLDEARLVDVGCGDGTHLLNFLTLGFRPEHLTGLELVKQRAEQARSRLPEAVTILCKDAVTSQLPERTFHVVHQAVVFSSILDTEIRQQLAAVMWSWVAPGGGVLWYDFSYNNPRNPKVRGIKKQEVLELFPHGEAFIKKITLAPPIARKLDPYGSGVHWLLNCLPFLRTHQLIFIQKKT